MHKRLAVRKIKEALLVCRDLRDLKKELELKSDDLAALLCPFKIGELVRLPASERWFLDDSTDEVRVQDIRLDTHYGYELICTCALSNAPACPILIAGDRVREFERFNRKAPIMSPDEIDDLLRPLNEPHTGYYL